MDTSHDPFDDLLNLEEEYHQEGYDEGFRAGAEAGRVEGYSLGLQKGFDKFAEAGRLQSKAVVWANRIPKYRQQQQNKRDQQRQHGGSGEDQLVGRDRSSASTGSTQTQTAAGEDSNEVITRQSDKSTANPDAAKGKGGQEEENPARLRLPPINSNPRLEKNIETLYGLVEPGTLSTNNDDEAVNDFDSRMKGAHGKLRIIERAVGEGPATGRFGTTSANARSPPPVSKNENIEDAGRIRPSASTGIKSTDI
ncbi:DUF1715-domain-containing protein [Astrocystis sublimbata]|nr:DUF1715-domain-containing protein [Astrocystis sublimbata]